MRCSEEPAGAPPCSALSGLTVDFAPASCDHIICQCLSALNHLCLLILASGGAGAAVCHLAAAAGRIKGGASAAMGEAVSGPKPAACRHASPSHLATNCVAKHVPGCGCSWPSLDPICPLLTCPCLPAHRCSPACSAWLLYMPAPHPTPPHTPSLQRQTTLLRTRTVGQSSKVRLRDHVTTVNTGEQRLAATRVQLAKWASRVGHTGGRGSRKP